MCRQSARSSGQQVSQRTSSKQNTQKKQLYSVSVKKSLKVRISSVNLVCIRKVRKIPVKPVLPVKIIVKE